MPHGLASFLRRTGLRRFFKSLKAATAIEYSLIAAGIALAIMLTVFFLGDELLALYDDVLASLKREMG